jgi:hypothetical protein
LLEPLVAAAGDEVRLLVASETGGGEGGIDVRWAAEQHRAGTLRALQSLTIAAGFLG